MRNLPAKLACTTMLVLCTALSADEAGTLVGLRNGTLVAKVSAATGQVVSLSDAGGTKFLASGEDKYDLDGKLSGEGEDTVVSKRATKDSATLECANGNLHLKLTKLYRLKGNVLEKVVRYISEDSDKFLLKVSSASRMEPGLFRGGYYYTTIDDGYKVLTVPFLAGTDVTVPSPWTIPTGSFVYYLPAKNRVFAHYRFKVNGNYTYGEANEIESEYLPGGAVTALRQGFTDNQTPLTVESRYVLIEGDPRDYHKHLFGLPPYFEHRNSKAPEWFKHARMFLSDGLPGTGRGLIEDREAVGRDVTSFLKLIPQDDYLMVFFNHWSTSGDYPYTGTFRYYLYDPPKWSDPVPVEKLKENIRWLKSLSPRIKVGGYIYFAPTEGTPPYEQHKDWFVYNKSNEMELGGDGIGRCGLPDFSTGYRDYILDQLKHAVTDLGFDWLHMDTGIGEYPNYRTKTVAQSREMAKFYQDLSSFCSANDKAIVQNVAWTTGLWSQGGYLECQQPDRWEKKDWRILAASGYLNALYRTCRPDTWVNLVYGTQGAYGLRNGFSGMRGWIRDGLNWWADVSHSLAHEKVIDELLQTKTSDVKVHPSWWRLETNKLEAEAFRIGQGLVVPMILHGEKAGVEQISMKTAEMRYQKGNYLFTFDMRLSSPEPIDVFKPVPWTADYLTLLSFRVEKALGATYVHPMKLEPRTNYYHLLTQTPAWVYSCNGQRTSLLLPENRGLRISGLLPIAAAKYRLTVENDNKTAHVLTYMPKEWRGANVTLGGKASASQVIHLLGERCLLLEVGKGKSDIIVSESKAAREKTPALVYANPQSKVWEESAQRVFYWGLRHRAYTEDGKSCLSLNETAPGGGTAGFPMLGGKEAGGFSLKMRGENTGGRLEVVLNAGDTWTYAIKDDFAGWREFNVYREQMSTSGKERKWDKVGNVYLRAHPATGKELNIADLKLLPARPGDITTKAAGKRRATVFKTKTPPVIDGRMEDRCWEHCALLTDFHPLGKEGISESKTKVKVCYDDGNLYVIFDSLESLDSVGKPQRRDAEIWNGDHVELYLDPYRDKANWFHLLVDPAGTIEDLRVSNTGRDFGWDGDFEVKTYLNWKASWVAEFKVPFKTLSKTPKPGDVWGINFARKDLSGEWSNWATSGEWLDPDNFGEMVFAGEGSAKPIAASNPMTDPDVLFYASFDGALKPELQKGEKGHEADLKAQFVPGHRGKALLIGYTRGASYPVKGSINVREGTITFWAMPTNWNRNQQLFHHFLMIPDRGLEPPKGARVFSLILYKFWEWDDVLAFGLNPLLSGEGLVSVPMKDTWAPGKWHHIVFAWDSTGVQLYVDGEGVSRTYKDKAPDFLAAEQFRIGGPYFKPNDALTAIDELCIYGRRLSPEEVTDLYSAEATG